MKNEETRSNSQERSTIASYLPNWNEAVYQLFGNAISSTSHNRPALGSMIYLACHN